MVRNILYALGPKQELTPGASISWAFDGRPAYVSISESGALTVNGPIADFPMKGSLKVTHTVAGTELTLPGDASNVVFSTGAGQHTILKFDWDGAEYVWESHVKTAVASLPQLSAPGSFAVTAVSSSQINATWSDVTGEANYELQRSIDQVNWSTIASPAANSTSYNNTGLTAETHYYYRIRSVGDGTTSASSPWVTASATTPAAGVTWSAVVFNPLSNITQSSGVWTSVAQNGSYDAVGVDGDAPLAENTEGELIFQYTAGAYDVAFGFSSVASLPTGLADIDMGVMIDSNTGNIIPIDSINKNEEAIPATVGNWYKIRRKANGTAQVFTSPTEGGTYTEIFAGRTWVSGYTGVMYAAMVGWDSAAMKLVTPKRNF